MSNVFLGGPISNAMHGNIFDGKIKKYISAIIKTLESKGHNVLSAYIEEDFGNNQCDIKEMFNIDISLINESESAVFFLYYDEAFLYCEKTFRYCEKVDGLLRTDGSYIEIGICYKREKPKPMPITIISNGPRKKLPNMLQSMIKQHSNRVKFIPFDEIKTKLV